ncbi:MAG: Wzz/FepE/Etk N-terminal domain-containing protein [Bacteroidia bacterium]|nr:Wzz/FepE/Etk N-terminal domain-containing protein [Bacteroidia bacterium]
MDLIGFLRVLLRRKWLILAIISVAMVTTALIALRAPKTYLASAQLATGLTDAGFSYKESTGYAPREYEVEARFKNLEELIRSPQVLELVSYQLILHDLEKTEPFRDMAALRSKYSQDELRIARERYRLKLEALQPLMSSDELERKHISILREMGYYQEIIRPQLFVRRVPGTDYIAIDFPAEDPYLAAFVVNTLCQEFVRYYANNRLDRSKESLDFYARMAAEKKAELDEKIRQWESRNPGTDIQASPAATVAPISRLEEAREVASQEALNAERQLMELNTTLPEAYRTQLIEQGASAGPSLASLLRSRMNRLNVRYVRGGMESTPLQDSIARTRQELASELFRTITGDNASLDADTRRLIEQKITLEITAELYGQQARHIDTELRQLSSRAGTFVSSSGTPGALDRDVEVARDAYLTILNKLNEARMSSADPVSSTISQVAYVQPPDQPQPSRTPLLVALSGLVSLSLCVVVLFMLEYLDHSIRYPSRLTAMTGQPLLGVLNRLNTRNLDLVSLFSDAHQDPGLESYKQLLRKIRHEVIEAGPRTLLITSTRPGTGKTALLVSLGYSLSISGKKVLLVDTNFKHNSLTQITAATPALEKYLRKELPRKLLISDSVFEGMDVIGCEGSNLSPAELFNSEDFENLLIELTEQYDFILMEGPQLNSFSDTRELERYAARVIPIFSATHTVNTLDQISLEYLRTLDAKAMGAVLNKVELSNLNL